MYIVVLSRTVVESDQRFDKMIIIFMGIVKTSVPVNSPTKYYTNLYDHNYTTNLYDHSASR